MFREKYKKAKIQKFWYLYRGVLRNVRFRKHFCYWKQQIPFLIVDNFWSMDKNFRHIYSEFMTWLNSYKKYTKYYFPIDFIFVCCTIKVTSLGLFYRSPSKCGIVLRIGALNLRTIVDSNSFFELVGVSYVLVKPFTRNN